MHHVRCIRRAVGGKHAGGASAACRTVALVLLLCSTAQAQDTGVRLAAGASALAITERGSRAVYAAGPTVQLVSQAQVGRSSAFRLDLEYARLRGSAAPNRDWENPELFMASVNGVWAMSDERGGPWLVAGVGGSAVRTARSSENIGPLFAQAGIGARRALNRNVAVTLEARLQAGLGPLLSFMSFWGQPNVLALPITVGIDWARPDERRRRGRR